MNGVPFTVNGVPFTVIEELRVEENTDNGHPSDISAPQNDEEALSIEVRRHNEENDR